jgi:hypothetical protein
VSGVVAELLAPEAAGAPLLEPESPMELQAARLIAAMATAAEVRANLRMVSVSDETAHRRRHGQRRGPERRSRRPEMT